jgi:hypothetical protein
MKDPIKLKELILKSVDFGKVLLEYNVPFNFNPLVADEAQFRCPFHGDDIKPSSRYYRSTQSAYCWVCKERWDIFSFLQKMEGWSFPETLNNLIKMYGVDTSPLPDVAEVRLKKAQEKTVVKVDERKMSIERLYQAITAVREEVPSDTFVKFVYSYMMLKWAVPDESFAEQYGKLKEAMPNTPLQMLERAMNIVAYWNFPDDIVQKFIFFAKKNGVAFELRVSNHVKVRFVQA